MYRPNNPALNQTVLTSITPVPYNILPVGVRLLWVCWLFGMLIIGCNIYWLVLQKKPITTCSLICFFLLLMVSPNNVLPLQCSWYLFFGFAKKRSQLMAAASPSLNFAAHQPGCVSVRLKNTAFRRKIYYWLALEY